MEINTHLPFSIYNDVPTKEIKKEILRQKELLASLGEESVSPEAEEIRANILALEKKKRQTVKDNTIAVVDKVIKWTLWAVMVVYSISLIVLPIWMVITSFKSAAEYTQNKFGFPQEWYFRNYSQVIEKMTIYDDWGNKITVLDEIANSLVYSLGGSLWSTFVTVITAYVLAKYRFPGSKFLYSLGIIIMIIPVVGNLPAAMYFRTKVIPTYDNMILTIFTSCCVPYSGMNFLLLYGAFKSMPWDYAEAVFVDGGNHFTAFNKMYVPMILPTAAVIFILNFVGAWNNYTDFMLWLPSTPNLAYGLYILRANANVGLSTPALLAGFTLIVIPTVAIYFASQKLIATRFNVGGLKG